MGKKRSAKQRQREAEVRKQAPKPVKVNRFELREQRQKHQVLGQRVKGQKGNRVQARDVAIKTREKTLLKDYQTRRKDGAFLDKRFGEYNTDMSMEEKMLARFAKEQRKKHSRSSLFNLDDDDDEAEEFLLTHNDKPLTEAMDDYIGSDDEVDERQKGTSMSADMVAKYHFGGGDGGDSYDNDDNDDGQPDRKKSHREIMAEVITKSKMHKRARQVQHEEAMELTDKLDAEMDDVMGILLAESNKAVKEGRVHAPPADLGYDMAVVDLAEETKAKATDRLKTPQELASEERERLEKLEQERIDRMNGMGVSSSNQQLEASTEYIGPGSKTPQDKRQADGNESEIELRHKDDGTAEFVNVKTGEVVDMTRLATNGGDDGDDDDNDDNDSDDEMDDLPAEQASDDELENDEDADEFGLEPAIKTNLAASIQQQDDEEDYELPFLYKPVTSVEQLLQLLSAHSTSKQHTVLTRLIACHNVHLGVEKKAVQQQHFEVLLDYAAHVTQAHQGPDMTQHLNVLLEPLYSLAQQMPQFTAETCRQRVLDMFKKLKTTSWPSFPRLRRLYLFQLLPVMFPVSDRWHPVVTPSLLVLANLLTHCNVGNLRNVAAGLYLCSVSHCYVYESQRYVPEAIGFINSTCALLVKHTQQDDLHRLLLPGFKLLHQSNPEALLLKQSKAFKKMTPQPLSYSSVEKGFKGQKLSQVKLDLAHTALQLASKYALLYKQHQALPEILAPTLQVCHMLTAKGSQIPQALKHAARVVIEAVGDSKRARPVCRFQAHKPVPLPMLEPEYNEYGVIRKGSADPHERETQRLKHELKKERKGAIRELRKDNRFLSKVRLQEVMENDADRNKKLNAIHHLLQSEQALHKKTGK
eukprot:TRINITY_DN7065_c0_g1_i3.p1 TRINITY_DN7065_c0_g1~~TRINITY_DN7065_c0_g1_i3.p1  ORF type:complete len:868 (+),score=243.11 TRINITY_DN7065_c0_g1_i3:96-2699(+)